MKDQLADIALDEGLELNGFKVGGILPFHLKPIRVSTHIRLCKIRNRIKKLNEGKEPSLEDFTNAELQEKIFPETVNYLCTGLINDRAFGWLYSPFLRKKIKECSHSQIFNLFATIQKLNEPAFFLAYWNLMNQKTDIILKEEEQS